VLTLRIVEALIEPITATMVVLPLETPVATPAAVMVAIEGLDEDPVALGVTSRVLLLAESAMNRLPTSFTATPYGPHKRAEVAGPLSPLLPQ